MLMSSVKSLSITFRTLFQAQGVYKIVFFLFTLSTYKYSAPFFPCFYDKKRDLHSRGFIIFRAVSQSVGQKKLSCIESNVPSDCGRSVWRQCALVGRLEGQLKWRARAVMCRRVCVYASGYNITYLSLSLWLFLQLSELNRDLFFPSRKKKNFNFLERWVYFMTIKAVCECRLCYLIAKATQFL